MDYFHFIVFFFRVLQFIVELVLGEQGRFLRVI